MKHLSRTIIAIFLAVLVTALMPAQVFADSLPEYISEIKVYLGDCSKAESEGFKILSKTDANGNVQKDKNGKTIPVDLNQGAGGGVGSKGNKAVYLGYKTTTDRKEAITDLALMNMKGGYSVKEYEALMETQMKSQIIPFVDSFLVTIKEYRENYNSDIEANRERAVYIHDILNKLTDDDCGGAGLGDLLLNETKYEMGDEAYNKLSDAEKKKHADILTIIAQANGKATLLIETLLARAADTNEDSWIDRFSQTTYEDLEELVGGSPTDAYNALSKLYEDDAQKILDMWDRLKEELENYDEASAAVENIEENEAEINELQTKVENLKENSDEDDVVDAVADVFEANSDLLDETENIGTVAVCDYLDYFDYGDGTLLDFFMQDREEVEADITVLYPLVASLTDGQRAGLDFINLKSLIFLAETDVDAYKEAELDSIEQQSIYDGVDRAIYEKGGVALTSKALREKAKELEVEDDSFSLSSFTEIMIIASAVSAIGLAISGAMKYSISTKLASVTAKATRNVKHLTRLNKSLSNASLDKSFSIRPGTNPSGSNISVTRQNFSAKQAALANDNQICNYLMTGFAVAMVVFIGVTTYLTYRDMKDHYKVDFTPIPHYMVDAEDITAYNENGEMIVIKNQSAYYKVVECNRKKGDDYFDTVGTCSDMNGGVGKQWLALYAAKNEAKQPILASSLRAVVDDSKIPSGYETGIHMFGTSAAFNLNNNLYDWNESAKSVFVYYKVDTTAPSTTGSNFTGGSLALAGGAGLVIGALATALGMTVTKKKKETKAEA